jgi:putative flippase GtrA
MVKPLPDAVMGLSHQFDRRIVRYGLVGAIGLPINNAALAVFLYATGGVFWLSLLLAFEVSTTVNYVLNQLYTYSDQKHVHGWDWPKRALKAQVSSASALALAIGVALVLRYGLHVQDFVATDIGIVVAFFYNFLLSRRLVFRPAGH